MKAQLVGLVPLGLDRLGGRELLLCLRVVDLSIASSDLRRATTNATTTSGTTTTANISHGITSMRRPRVRGR